MKALQIANKNTMSSLEIAELTGKEHSKVTSDIKRILEEAKIDASGFTLTQKYGNNNERIIFNLPYRETQLVISGYSVPHRLIIIDRWQELELAQPKIPQTFAEALRLAADTQEALDKANEQIEQDKPKVDFAMAVRNMHGACEVGEFSKVIGIGRNTFFEILRNDGVLMRTNLPYQRYLDNGCFIVKEHIPYTDSKGKTHPAFTTMVTGKGQVFLEKKYRKQEEA